MTCGWVLKNTSIVRSGCFRMFGSFSTTTVCTRYVVEIMIWSRSEGVIKISIFVADQTWQWLIKCVLFSDVATVYRNPRMAVALTTEYVTSRPSPSILSWPCSWLSRCASKPTEQRCSFKMNNQSKSVSCRVKPYFLSATTVQRPRNWIFNR